MCSCYTLPLTITKTHWPKKTKKTPKHVWNIPQINVFIGYR